MSLPSHPQYRAIPHSVTVVLLSNLLLLQHLAVLLSRTTMQASCCNPIVLPVWPEAGAC